MPLCSPGAYPVTGETLHEAEDGAVEDVGDDAAVVLLLPPPAAGARHLGWGHSTGLGPAPPARLRGGEAWGLPGQDKGQVWISHTAGDAIRLLGPRARSVRWGSPIAPCGVGGFRGAV